MPQNVTTVKLFKTFGLCDKIAAYERSVLLLLF